MKFSLKLRKLLSKKKKKYRGIELVDFAANIKTEINNEQRLGENIDKLAR